MAGEPSRSMKCDIMTCDSEMETAHRNYALLHYLKDMKARDTIALRRVWLRRAGLRRAGLRRVGLRIKLVRGIITASM